MQDRRAKVTRKAATTADIVNTGKRARRVPAKWRPYYDRLLTLREGLIDRQHTLATDAVVDASSATSHIADAGTDTYDRDWALGMLSSEQNALYQIEQALDRIYNGTYGVCELTGKDIDPRRLEAIPWTRFSVEAESELEAQGSRKRTRIGPRAALAEPSDSAVNEDAEDT